MNSRLSANPTLSRKRGGGGIADRVLRRELHAGRAPDTVGGFAAAPADHLAPACKARYIGRGRAGRADRQKPSLRR